MTHLFNVMINPLVKRLFQQPFKCLATSLYRPVGIILLYCSSLYAFPGHAALISFSPSDSFDNIGDTVQIDLLISDFDQSESLGAFDIDLQFNDSVLSLTQLTFGDQLNLEGFGSLSDWSFSGGDLNLSEISLDDPNRLLSQQADQFVLATIDFEAINPGVSALTISNALLSDVWGGELAYSTTDANVTITEQASHAVPAPATSVLLFLSLVGLIIQKLLFLKRMRISD